MYYHWHVITIIITVIIITCIMTLRVILCCCRRVSVDWVVLVHHSPSPAPRSPDCLYTVHSVLYTVHPTLHCTPLFWWPTHLAWTQVHQMMKIATLMNFNYHNIIIMFMSLPVLIGWGGRKRFPVFSVRKFSFASQWLTTMAVTTKQLSFLIISSNIYCNWKCMRYE